MKCFMAALAEWFWAAHADRSARRVPARTSRRPVLRPQRPLFSQARAPVAHQLPRLFHTGEGKTQKRGTGCESGGALTLTSTYAEMAFATFSAAFELFARTARSLNSSSPDPSLPLAAVSPGGTGGAGEAPLSYPSIPYRLPTFSTRLSPSSTHVLTVFFQSRTSVSVSGLISPWDCLGGVCSDNHWTILAPEPRSVKM